MRALVLHAHPVPESYSAALLERVMVALPRAGYEVECAGLYAGDDPGQAELSGVDHLVLVYPTWWGGLPAILLDWVQRRVGPWLDHRVPRSTSPLRDVRALTAVTSHGSSELINRLQGEPGKTLLRRGLLPLCSPGAELAWLALYKLDRASPQELNAFLDRVEAAPF